MNIDLWPLVVYVAAVVALVLSLPALSALFGQKRKDHSTHEVYESGVEPVGSSQLRLSVPFYLTAILFIIFDLEVVFLLAWAISVREVGWLGFIEALVFIIILMAGLLYLWRSGALEWRTMRQLSDLERLPGPGGVVNVADNSVEGHNRPS